ncbi:MAG: YceI family protein [Flavobacteriaceae bacterium]|nr:YceI family protein [Flavobacteriaceae bacterium]
MKKVILCLLVSSLFITSCKKDTKQPEETTQEAKTPTYSVDANTTEINWTAYKTTEKTPVKGIFTSLNIDNPIQSDSKHGAFANLEFSIPISSFFSENEIRDNKIKALFFGIMKETILISGRFSDIIGNDEEGTMSLNLKMNGETIAIPMKYTISDNKVDINGTITNLMDWKMDAAFKSLHKACELLHTGEDGISKTWEDVAINATAVLKRN